MPNHCVRQGTTSPQVCGPASIQGWIIHPVLVTYPPNFKPLEINLPIYRIQREWVFMQFVCTRENLHLYLSKWPQSYNFLAHFLQSFKVLARLPVQPSLYSIKIHVLLNVCCALVTVWTNKNTNRVQILTTERT